jgi:hypothetical protein
MKRSKSGLIFCSRKCKEHKLRKELKYCIWCGNSLNKNAKKCCSQECLNIYRFWSYINKWQIGIENGISGKRGTCKRIKEYLKIKYKSKCQRCGWSEINPVTNQSPLHLHHIDGNYKNNKEDNLELLCPNCHSITPNFGSLNLNNSHRTFDATSHKG